jgi:hypothetical protein
MQSNFNGLANQFGKHLNLVKREKLASNSLTNQLGKNRNLAKPTSPGALLSYDPNSVSQEKGVAPPSGTVRVINTR